VVALVEQLGINRVARENGRVVEVQRPDGDWDV
jgi:hypothetical protein